MLAITRLATFHPNVLARDIHTIVGALVYEVKNLRSSVARSAIFTLGELFIKMKKHVEPVSAVFVPQPPTLITTHLSPQGHGCDRSGTVAQVRREHRVHSRRHRQGAHEYDREVINYVRNLQMHASGHYVVCLFIRHSSLDSELISFVHVSRFLVDSMPQSKSAITLITNGAK